MAGKGHGQPLPKNKNVTTATTRKSHWLGFSGSGNALHSFLGEEVLSNP